MLSSTDSNPSDSSTEESEREMEMEMEYRCCREIPSACKKLVFDGAIERARFIFYFMVTLKHSANADIAEIKYVPRLLCDNMRSSIDFMSHD
ncbi:hypothetical protein P5673_022589 [Acropora cervicornis]|uniref:Uncharacterized protein n=1 Tax=Acropora cervicornis TaxID=6130 RepID=A0AAD9UZR6_ACRCE|nr:hypothetical protein P5673_022589 [Acropora cervicornis]